MKALSTGQLSAILDTLPASFRRSLLAQNRSPGTVRSYCDILREFYAYLISQGMPTGINAIRREHIETFITHLLTEAPGRKGERMAPSTVAKYYKALHVYFAWALEEGEISAHPMQKMKRPTVPDTPPTVPTQDAVRALLRACEGRDFYARRDTALIRLLIDTGLRASEIAGIRVSDIDWTTNSIEVLGKGRKVRSVPFGRKTAQALDRYKRAREQYPAVRLNPDVWWLGRGHGNRLTPSGVQDIIRRRCKQAGIDKLYPHLFRHAFAHNWLSKGGSEGGLMRLAGWSSRTMVQRYGASAATKRAHEEHARLQTGDDF